MFKLYIIVFLTSPLFCTGTPIGCNEDAHCPSGFYCRPDEFRCSECINCTQMRRLPPLVDNECITRVTECGSCFKGLVDNMMSAECAAPESRSILRQLPTYAWAVLALGMLVLGLVVCLAAAYVMRNFNAFKVLACYTRTSVQSSPVTVTRDHDAVGAPPSYESVAGPTADSSGLEESRPFIQSTDVSVPRECQTARLFSRPTCINGDGTNTESTNMQRSGGQTPNRGQTDSTLNSSPNTVYPELSLRTEDTLM